MNDGDGQAAAMRAAFDRIEESYEFMLAYAAQGRAGEGDESGGGIRTYLARLAEALDAMEAALAPGLAGDPGGAFARRVREDIAAARGAIAILCARPAISSGMVDNTNALLALRALLTDIFFLDQVALPPP